MQTQVSRRSAVDERRGAAEPSPLRVRWHHALASLVMGGLEGLLVAGRVWLSRPSPSDPPTAAGAGGSTEPSGWF